jgi:divinyl protochlorophyllide a 8-vinyl-reductase
MQAFAQARIGPNAIIQLVEALRDQRGVTEARRLLGAVGQDAYFDQPPSHMVPQTEVVALHHQLFDTVGREEFKRISAQAGRRTGDYLLDHRIPKAVQWVLRRLPDALAARVLSNAIKKHAWTFAGSGTFSYQYQSGLVFSITGNPIAAGLRSEVPMCDYYAATFERIFRVIVNDAWRVVERSCEACGDAACVFQIGSAR